MGDLWKKKKDKRDGGNEEGGQNNKSVFQTYRGEMVPVRNSDVWLLLSLSENKNTARFSWVGKAEEEKYRQTLNAEFPREFCFEIAARGQQGKDMEHTNNRPHIYRGNVHSHPMRFCRMFDCTRLFLRENQGGQASFLTNPKTMSLPGTRLRALPTRTPHSPASPACRRPASFLPPAT